VLLHIDYTHPEVTGVTGVGVTPPFFASIASVVAN
jgi:hypothetical protein